MRDFVAVDRFRLCGALAAAAILSALSPVGVGSQGAKLPQAPLQKSQIALPKDITLPIMVPFSLWNGLAVVEGSVAGTSGERFLLATGTNACTLSPAAWERTRLTAEPETVRVDLFDSALVATEAQTTSVQLNLLKLDKVRFAKLDACGAISRSNPPDAPQVWLGTPFFLAFQVTFDFSTRNILLNAPQAPLPKIPGTVVVPLTLRDGRLWVKASVPGAKPFTALVDTGTNGTLIPGELAAKLPGQPLRTFTLTLPNGKEAKAGLVTLPKLSVGRAEVENVRAVFLAADAPAEFDRSLAILGMDFLSHFKVTLNYARKQLALAPLSPEAALSADDAAAAEAAP